MHLMLDIETLSTRPDAAVFEVGLVPFDADGPIGELRLLWMPKTGHIDADTVRWWLMRKEPCALTSVDPRSDEGAAAKALHDYMKAHSEDMLWANPTSFDCVIVESLLRRYDLPMPIGFRNWRDVRTLRMIAGWPPYPSPREGSSAHSAIDDCRRQVDTVTACWKAMQR